MSEVPQGRMWGGMCILTSRRISHDPTQVASGPAFVEPSGLGTMQMAHMHVQGVDRPLHAGTPFNPAWVAIPAWVAVKNCREFDPTLSVLQASSPLVAV